MAPAVRLCFPLPCHGVPTLAPPLRCVKCTIVEIDQVEVVELELKYCERCGGLWLRLCGDDEVYCVSCRLTVSRLPACRRMHVTMSSDRRVEIESRDFPVLCKGGHA